MRKQEVVRTRKNSLSYWYEFRNPLRVCLNYSIIRLCKWLPSMMLKRGLYRLIGVKVGKDVSVGLDVQLDIFFPDMIEIGDNSLIGYNVTILCHEFLVKEFRKAPVKIGKNVMIGANSTVLSGVTIGDNSVISAMSLVNKDIPKNSFVGGIPAKVIKTL